MKNKIMEFLHDAVGEIAYGIKCLCGKPTPLKRLVIVLAMCGILSVAFIYTIVTSIYGIARKDAEKKFLELEHIRRLELTNNSNMSNKNYAPKDTLKKEKVK
jgi:hypothetical protein